MKYWALKLIKKNRIQESFYFYNTILDILEDFRVYKILSSDNLIKEKCNKEMLTDGPLVQLL